MSSNKWKRPAGDFKAAGKQTNDAAAKLRAAREAARRQNGK